MRIIGLDLGERRIGVAVADEGVPVAVPLTTLIVGGDPIDAIVRLAREHQAGELIVGLPLTLSGAVGSQAERVMTQVHALEARLPIPVRTWDERLTTIEAGYRAKSASAHTQSRRGRHDGRAKRDAMAATIILQAYLDSRRA